MSDSSNSPSVKMTTSPSPTTIAKPPVPVVEWPKLGTVYSNYIRFSGTCEEGATVEMRIESKWVAVSAIGTKWTHMLKDLEGGHAYNYEIQQIVNDVVSDTGPVPTFIVREKGKIPLPVVMEPPINSYIPVNGVVQFKGTCELNAEVFLHDINETLLGKATVTGNEWLFECAWSNSEVVFVKIRQLIGDDVSDVVERWVGVGLDSNKYLSAVITDPAEDFGPVYVGTYVDFSGPCTANTGTNPEVTMHDPRYAMWYGTVVGDRWFVRAGPFRSKGNYKLMLRIADGYALALVNAWGTADRVFDVVDGVPPAPPTIRIPLTGTTHPTGTVAVDGLCGERHTVELLDGAGKKLTDALVVDNKWYASLTLGEGSYSIKARQTRNGLVSQPSALVEFRVVKSDV